MQWTKDHREVARAFLNDDRNAQVNAHALFEVIAHVRRQPDQDAALRAILASGGEK